MAKQVPWTRELVESFEREALLSEEEVYILKTRIKGYTITKQASDLHKSEATIQRTVRLLKHKYDVVQAEHPDMFPVRKHSIKELY